MTTARQTTLLAIALAGAALVSGCDGPTREGASQPPAATPDASAISGLSAPASVGRVTELEGTVMRVRLGLTASATISPLQNADVLETYENSRAVVELPDGRVLEIGPDAHVTFRGAGDKTELEVKRGLLMSRPRRSDAGIAAAEPEGSTLRILTPFGETRVRTLAELSIEVGSDSAAVDVTFGAVLHTSTNGQPVEITMGQVARITRSESKVEEKSRRLLLPLDIVLTPDGAKVEVQQKGQGKWKKLGKQWTLVEGDGVRVKSGLQRVDLPGSGGLSLQSGSEVSWGMVSSGDGTVAVRLDLKAGAVKLEAGSPTRLELGGGATVQTDGSASVSVARKGKGIEVSSAAGDAELTTATGKSVVKAGQLARVSGQGDVTVVELDRPGLLLPARVGLRVMHPGLEQVALGWEGAQAESFFVEVASDAAFTGLLLSGVVHKPYVTAAAPVRGTLNWRVRTQKDGKIIDRGSAAFMREPPVRNQSGAENEVRDGADSTTIYFQDELPAITLLFKKDAAASSNKVSVFAKGSLDRPVLERTVPAADLSLPKGSLTEGSYLWTVTPLSATGEPLRGGKMNKLEIIYDNSLTTTLVGSPRNGAAFGASVTADGVAPVGATLVVNGKPAPLDDKHRFRLDVPVWSPPAMVVFRQQLSGAPDLYIVRVGARRK